MAWEIFGKDDVENDMGVAADSLTDAHYNEAVSFAEEWMGRKLTGTATYTAELHDGDGTDILFVNYPPIVSVSELLIDQVSWSSDFYHVYDAYIRLDSLRGDQIDRAMFGPAAYFPHGQENVSITYVGGTAVADVSPKVIRGLKLLVVQMATFRERGGADANYIFDTSRPRDETGSPASYGGQVDTIAAICARWLGRRVRVA